MIKHCPECGHEFQGNGWDGIDAHWRAKHETVMRYEEAWPHIKAGSYARYKEGKARSEFLEQYQKDVENETPSPSST